MRKKVVDYLNEATGGNLNTKEVNDLLLKAGIDDEYVSKSKGKIIYRRGFFYTHGNNSKKVREQIDKALEGSNYKTDNDGEVYKPFKGGASVANQSHWWVTIVRK